MRNNSMKFGSKFKPQTEMTLLEQYIMLPRCLGTNLTHRKTTFHWDFWDQKLISYHYSSCSCSSCSCWGNHLQISPRLHSVVSNLAGMFFTKNMHWLTETDFWSDVMISRWRPWRHLTQNCAATLGECTDSVFLAAAQHRPAVPDL